MRKQQTASDNLDRVRKQLLDLMSASKAVIDARNNGNHQAILAAVERLQGQYISAVVLMKDQQVQGNVPALLRPPGGTLLERQMYEFREALSVGLGES
mgnify:CR=1 FL=1|jgi:hypothetical protein